MIGPSLSPRTGTSRPGLLRYTHRMTGRPAEAEASPHLFTYIEQVPGDDPLAVVESQLEESLALFAGISEAMSLHRYEPEKWSIRQVLNHLSDTERAFAFRVLWLGRGFDQPLPGFDQHTAVSGAEANSIPWAAHVEEFRQVRLSTISLLRNMPHAGWTRGGIVNDNFVSVRALAYIIPGHVAHHLAILRERYL